MEVHKGEIATQAIKAVTGSITLRVRREGARQGGDSAEDVGDLTFVLPFSREDVFKEVARFGRPLGVPTEGPGAIKFQAPTGAPYAGIIDEQFQVGWQRAALFQDSGQEGYAVIECIELMPGWVIKWKQLQTQKKGIHLAGDNPEISIKFADTPEGGTWVWFEMDFSQVAIEGGEKLSDGGARLRAEFKEQKPKSWTEDMVARGYTPKPITNFSYDPRLQA
eukprot:3813434-Prymnesium_polylepis.1